MSKSYFLVKLRKFESASTVMYCILSSFIQENTQRLSVTIYTHYSLAVWLRSFTKWVMSKKKKKKKGVTWQRSSMHEFKKEDFSSSDLLFDDSTVQHDAAQHLQPYSGGDFGCMPFITLKNSSLQAPPSEIYSPPERKMIIRKLCS